MKRELEMHNPPHPGGVLRRLYLEPLKLTVTDAAGRLGVSRKQLSQLVNERAGFSPEMALRVAMATNTTAESWIGMQSAYDLWKVGRRRRGIKVRKLAA